MTNDTTSSDAPAGPDSASEGTDGTEHWRDLTAQVGREVAEPLSAALERVIQLATTGKIDRDSLRALRTEIEGARRIGIVSQQLARFGAKRLRQSDERLDLAQTLQSVLVQRAREVSSRGIEVRHSTRPIVVLADPALLFSLLNSLIDWAIEQRGRRIAFRVDQPERQAHGRISCHVNELPPEPLHPPELTTLNWHLMTQIAAALGLPVETVREPGRTAFVIEFPRTVGGTEAAAVGAPDPDHGGASSLNSKPLAGSQVLVVSARRELRLQVRQAIANMGLVIDFVGSVEEAASFCRDGVPHALIFEGVLSGDRLTRLAAELRDEVPSLVLIEIAEEGRAVEMSALNGLDHVRVGRDGLQQALPSTLVFELSKQL